VGEGLLGEIIKAIARTIGGRKEGHGSDSR